jgi:hypothetical protein
LGTAPRRSAQGVRSARYRPVLQLL